MRRREFITLLGCAAAAWPLAARAQQTRAAPIVGLVSIAASAADAGNFRGFLEQMRELGYVDGANIAFDKRFAGGREELIEGYVADLVRRPCLDTEGWRMRLQFFVAARLSVICATMAFQRLSCRTTLWATSIGERPCVVSPHFSLYWPCYRFFVRRRQLKCPICRKTCARGLPR
jgi:hypothetical protein